MSKFTPTNIKGAGDACPAEQIMRMRVTDILRRNFEAYGYLPIETAQINYLDLLTYKYDSNAEIVREIYKIRDQGDRDLGLRFDLTVPFAKYIAMNRNIKMPFKRYEIGKVWRNGPVKSGRAREFYQCDVDAVGISGIYIEAELMALAVKCYLEMGIEPIIRYGNRKLIDANLIPQIDKMSKGDAMKLIGQVQKNDEIIQLEKALKELGIDKYCEFAPYIVRGLNVYTGTVYEVFDKAERIPSALGGGGRYDKIITDFIDNGQQYPAVGISFGLEPICAVLNEKLKTKNEKRLEELIDLMLIPLGTESFCQTYADKLRQDGKRVLVYLGGGKVGRAFEYAAANNIRNCAVIGEDEVNGKAIVIKEIK